MPIESDHIAALIKAQTDIVRLETHIAYQTTAINDLRASNALQTQQLEEIRTLLSEARGGWRVLLLVGGAAGTVGAAITWASQFIHWR